MLQLRPNDSSADLSTIKPINVSDPDWLGLIILLIQIELIGLMG
jgi:hypothetical protein